MPKPYVKGLTITSGLLSMSGNVFTPKRPNAAATESFNLACPAHTDKPHKVSQRYVCPEDDTIDPFLPAECLKGKEVNGELKLFSKEDIEAAKKSDLPARTLELSFHPYDPTRTFASGSAYIFQPETPQQFFATLLESLDSNGVVTTDSGPKMACGLVSLRAGTEAFVRLERWGNQLVLREMVRPEDVAEFDEVDASVDVKNINLFKQLVDATAEEFDPEAYKSRLRDRIAALVDAGGDGTVPAPVERKTTAPDLEALLRASIEAAKGK